MSFANILDFSSAVRKSVGHFLHTKDISPGGTGAHAPAAYFTDPTLPRHTIYAPAHLEDDSKKYPLVIWANGAGMGWGLMHAHFLREIASHGYIVIANGRAARGLVSMGSAEMLEAFEWASASASGEDVAAIRRHIDLSRIALSGQSKGGLDTYAAAAALRSDPRVKSIGLFNSGLLRREAELLAQVTELTVPTFYFIGGAADVAYKNAEKDWKILPKNLPAWYGNLDVGHMGTFYDDENGGAFAQAAVLWLDFMLKNDESAKNKLFQLDMEKWKILSQNL